jgi:hypothetical protein
MTHFNDENQMHANGANSFPMAASTVPPQPIDMEILQSPLLH